MHQKITPMLIRSNRNHQWSPKFGQPCHNSYGIRLDRQNLIDQIITNCQKAQEPSKCRRSFSSSKNCGTKVYNGDQRKYEKQNQRIYLSPRSYQQKTVLKQKLYESSINRQSNDPIKQKNPINIINSQAIRASPLQTQKNNQNHQYFKKNNKKIMNTPIYKFRTNVQLLKCKSKQSIPSNIKICKTQPQNNIDQYEKLVKKIEEEKEKHVEHCKNQQQKLRIYYTQLQKKLCETRNRELKSLTEYESNKLQQFDQCLKNFSASMDVEECLNKLNEFSKYPTVRVKENIQLQINGCLTNGVNGVYFSFDQSNMYDLNML